MRLACSRCGTHGLLHTASVPQLARMHELVRSEACARTVTCSSDCDSCERAQEAEQRCAALAQMAEEAEKARKHAETMAQSAEDGDEDEGLCVVCMENAADFAFLPCGHRCVCEVSRCPKLVLSETCSSWKNVEQGDAEALKKAQLLTCPLCRQPGARNLQNSPSSPFWLPALLQ